MLSDQTLQEVIEIGTKVLCEASFDNGRRETPRMLGS